MVYALLRLRPLPAERFRLLRSHLQFAARPSLMSLKIFHICFILLSTILAAGSAVWAFREAANLVLGWVCAAFALIMPPPAQPTAPYSSCSASLARCSLLPADSDSTSTNALTHPFRRTSNSSR